MAKLHLSSDQYHFETDKGRECYVVGRQADCDFIILNQTVSRVHAEIFWRPAGWFVRDLDSKHGIWVNGVSTPMAKLKDGDELQLGEQVLHVKVVRESPISSARLQKQPDEKPETEPQHPVIKIAGMGAATAIMRVQPKPKPPEPDA